MVKKIKRQITLPTPAIGILETLIFSCVFLTTAAVALKNGDESIILPLLIFVFVMMASMISCGVYRSDIARSIAQVYLRTILGYMLAGLCLYAVTEVGGSQYLDIRFIAFVLVFSFCVISTIRPLIQEAVSPADDRRI